MKKSDMVRGMSFGTEFLTELYKEVIELGGTEEMIFQNMKNGGLVKEFAKLIVVGTNGVKKLTLKFLEIVKEGIEVISESFAKDSFFSNGPVKLYFWDNFKNWILPAIPDMIPAFQGKLLKTRLTKSMYDSEILNELGQPKPFSVGEFAAIIRDLLMKQSKGEEGELLSNGWANIFYVQLNVRLVVVSVYWYSADHEWYCDAYGLGADDGWNDGYYVFSRS